MEAVTSKTKSSRSLRFLKFIFNLVLCDLAGTGHRQWQTECKIPRSPCSGASGILSAEAT